MNSLSPSALPLLRTCRYTGRVISELTTRGFTSSAKLQRRTVPAFKDASSPELDHLLQTFRTKIILPNYLNQQQSKLVFKQKYASQLTNDPVIATIGDEEFRLEPLNLKKDIPRTVTALRQILAFTKDHADWLNWLSILEGLGKDLKCRKHWEVKFVRKAITAGESDVVIHALRQVGRNGMTLSKPGLRKTLFHFLRIRAKDQGWSKEALEETFDCAREAVQLMEAADHCGKRTVGEHDPRAEPLTLATLVELSARRAGLGEDENGRNKALAERYAEKLVQALEQQDTDLKTLQDSGSLNDILELEDHKKNTQVYLQKMNDWIPVWHALRLMGSSDLSLSTDAVVGIEKWKAPVAQLLDLVRARYRELGLQSPSENVTTEWDQVRG